MATQIEKNAAIVAQGVMSDWRNAYTIACSVQPGVGHGGGQVRSSALDGKVSPNEFARLVKEKAGGKVYGMGRDGIVAALAKWDEVASKSRTLKTSDQLTPADAKIQPTYPDRPWKEESGGAKTKEDDIARNVEAMKRAIQSNPKVAEAAAQAVVRHAPKTVAREVADDHDASREVSRARLSKMHSPEQRRRLHEENKELEDTVNSALADATTSLEHTDLVHHQATLDIIAARRFLRHAAGEFERNPHFTEDQRRETDSVLAECEHLISLLRGEKDEWTTGDREFLDAIGIEEGV